MSPSGNESPSMELPPPVTEQAPVAPESKEKPAVDSETALQGAEKAAAQPPQAQPTLPAIPLPEPPALGSPAAQGDVSATTQVPILPTLNDNDLIEKEWVNKAKQIVERTRDDPYKQSEELTVFKADYMKKHYDKTIKINK